MSNLSSTSTEPLEEAGNSFVHSVRKYDLKDQVYPLVRHMDYVHEFAASTTSLRQPGYWFQFKRSRPGKLQIKSELLFTNRHFILNLASVELIYSKEWF